jgi:AcrR family transcriptional regulator
MVAAVAQHGYPGTTVGHIVGLAGVSRTTFYQHFTDKQDCFLRTYEMIIAEGTQRISSGYRAQGDWRERLQTGFDEYSTVIAGAPAAARLVVIDSLSLGQGVLEYRLGAAQAFERMIRQSFDQAPGHPPVADATIRAIVAGIRRVVHHLLLAGQEQRLPALADQLLEWALSYLPGPGDPIPPPADPLPALTFADRGTPPLTDGLGPTTHRQRIMRAVAALVHEGGYSCLTIPAISARAGVSNQTFYASFASKDDAFLAAFDDAAARALSHSAEAPAAGPGWPRAVCASIEALLTFLACDPAFSRMAFFDVLAAGPAAFERSELVLNAFAALLAPGFALRPALPALVGQAIVGGIWGVLHCEIAAERTLQLPELAPCISYIALAPFVGAADAAATVAAVEFDAVPNER